MEMGEIVKFELRLRVLSFIKALVAIAALARAAAKIATVSLFGIS